MKIYKHLFCTALFLLVLIGIGQECFAVQKGRIEYENTYIDFSNVDYDSVSAEAELLFYNGETATNKEDRLKFYDMAMGKYQLLTMIDSSQVYPYSQLARIYDEKNKDRMAKSYFYRATNLDVRNPYTNFYFGEFYFKRKQYRRALNYYKISYNNGYHNSYELNQRLGIIYEKLADLVTARKYYETSLKINPDNSELESKINSINSKSYENSEYYYFIRE